MNKILFLILALILSACTPQVTVTSEVTVTLIPTETPTEIPIPTFTTTPKIDTFTSQYGLEVVLGETLPDGSQMITEFVSPEGLDEDALVNWHKQHDETRLGLEGDWVKTIDGRIVLLGDVTDSTSILAEYKLFEQINTPQFVFDGNKLVADNESSILSVAEIEEWRGGLPINYNEVQELSVEMVREAVKPLSDMLRLQGNNPDLHGWVPAGYILSADRKYGISIRYVVYGSADTPSARVSSEGVVFFRNAEGGYTYFFVENFKLEYID